MNLTLPQRLAILLFRWGPSIFIGWKHGWLWGVLAFVALLVTGAVLGWIAIGRVSPRHVELFGFVKLAVLGGVAVALGAFV